ncbi:MAG TPA: hypothetical protein VMA71_08150 [Alloacidobacterium sp.]|nr:hypothetical protein [Alloacidobacterium sp.]
MNSIVVSSIFFAAIFAAALLGMAIRRALPEDHVGSDAKEAVRLATGLMATMAALVLGMLVSSAKSSYDATKNEVAEMSSDVVAIDRLLAKFGPETEEIRAEFRQLVEFGLDRIWPREASRQTDLRPGDHGQILADKLMLLVPRNDTQVAVKTQAISMVVALQKTQWLLFLKSEQKPIPIPLLVVLISWLAAIFVGFGLFAPSNTTVVATLALSALAVSSAIFIILEMYTPFGGVMRISPAPIVEALKQMGR